MKEQTFVVKDMFCEQCENVINKHLLAMDGVHAAQASLAKGEVTVLYDESVCREERIVEVITKAGYTVKEDSNINTLVNGISILVIIFGLWYIINAFGWNQIFQNFPEATDGMSYAMLFVIGLLTSFHCIAMCGGLNLAGSLQNERVLKSTVLYNLGRLVSYTVIGGLLGALGSVLAITLKMRAIIGILAGIVMVFMGIKMMNCFPFMKKLYIPMPKSLKKKLFQRKHNSSFYIGLVNGFMPCGPLQTMQLLAIAGGSFLGGALSMFFFCLGTVPLLLLFGLAVGTLKNKAKQIMALVGGTLIVVFGVYMLQNNFALTGIELFPKQNVEDSAIIAMQYDDVQVVDSILRPGSYDVIQVKAGVPVEWNITADKASLNGCNGEIVIPEYDIDIKLKEGVNTITFTPTETGTVNYSCWMGMIRSKIVVVN